MAKSRRNVSRKNRSRRNRRNGGGLLGKLYGPIHQVFGMAENTVGAVTDTTKKVLSTGLRGVDRVGLSITGRTNKAVRNLVSRKSRKASRKNRKASRKNRK